MESIDQLCEEIFSSIPEKLSKSLFMDLFEKDKTLFDAQVFELLKDEFGFVKRALLFDHTLKTDIFLTHDWGMDEHGRDNHERVARLNAALKARGIITWFDNDRLDGNIIQKMCDGIDKTSIVFVFITRRYLEKVNNKSGNDNCQLEFNYALQRISPAKMIPVVMEESCLNPKSWEGPVGMALGNNLYIDYTSDDKLDDMVEDICKIISKKLRPILLNLADDDCLPSDEMKASDNSIITTVSEKSEVLEWMSKNNVEFTLLTELITNNILTKNKVALLKDMLQKSSVKEAMSLFKIIKGISNTDLQIILEIIAGCYFSSTTSFSVSTTTISSQSLLFEVDDEDDIEANNDDMITIMNVDSSEDEEVHKVEMHKKSELSNSFIQLTREEMAALQLEDNLSEIIEKQILPFLSEESSLQLFLYYTFQYLIHLLRSYKSYHLQYQDYAQVNHFHQMIESLTIASDHYLLSHYQQYLKALLKLKTLKQIYTDKEFLALQLSANESGKRKSSRDYSLAKEYYEKKCSIRTLFHSFKDNFLALRKKVRLLREYQPHHLSNPKVTKIINNLFHLLFFTKEVLYINDYSSIFQMMKVLNLVPLWKSLLMGRGDVQADQEEQFSFSLSTLTQYFSFSVKDYLSFGYTLNDFRNVPNGITLLLTHCYLSKSEEDEEENDRCFLSLTDLKNAQITLEDIRQANYFQSLEEILSFGIYTVEDDLLYTKYSLQILKSYGFTLQQIKEAGVYTLQDFIEDGSIYLLELILPSGFAYPVEEVLSLNYYSREEIKLFLCTNYSFLTTEIKQTLKNVLHFSAKELKDILNISALEMYETLGYSMLELILAKYKIDELLLIPGLNKNDYADYEIFTLENCLKAGISLNLLLEKGYTMEELIEAGIGERDVSPLSAASSLDHEDESFKTIEEEENAGIIGEEQQLEEFIAIVDESAAIENIEIEQAAEEIKIADEVVSSEVVDEIVVDVEQIEEVKEVVEIAEQIVDDEVKQVADEAEAIVDAAEEIAPIEETVEVTEVSVAIEQIEEPIPAEEIVAVAEEVIVEQEVVEAPEEEVKEEVIVSIEEETVAIEEAEKEIVSIEQVAVEQQEIVVEQTVDEIVQEEAVIVEESSEEIVSEQIEQKPESEEVEQVEEETQPIESQAQAEIKMEFSDVDESVIDYSPFDLQAEIKANTSVESTETEQVNINYGSLPDFEWKASAECEITELLVDMVEFVESQPVEVFVAPIAEVAVEVKIASVSEEAAVEIVEIEESENVNEQVLMSAEDFNVIDTSVIITVLEELIASAQESVLSLQSQQTLAPEVIPQADELISYPEIEQIEVAPAVDSSVEVVEIVEISSEEEEIQSIDEEMAVCADNEEEEEVVEVIEQSIEEQVNANDDDCSMILLNEIPVAEQQQHQQEEQEESSQFEEKKSQQQQSSFSSNASTTSSSSASKGRVSFQVTMEVVKVTTTVTVHTTTTIEESEETHVETSTSEHEERHQSTFSSSASQQHDNTSVVSPLSSRSPTPSSFVASQYPQQFYSIHRHQQQQFNQQQQATSSPAPHHHVNDFPLDAVVSVADRKKLFDHQHVSASPVSSLVHRHEDFNDDLTEGVTSAGSNLSSRASSRPGSVRLSIENEIDQVRRSLQFRDAQLFCTVEEEAKLQNGQSLLNSHELIYDQLGHFDDEDMYRDLDDDDDLKSRISTLIQEIEGNYHHTDGHDDHEESSLLSDHKSNDPKYEAKDDQQQQHDDNSTVSSNRNYSHPEYSERKRLLILICEGKVSKEIIRHHGVTIPELRRHGCRVSDFLKIGYSLKELKNYPFPINEYKRARITLRELRAAGYTIADMKRVKSHVLIRTERPLPPPVSGFSTVKQQLLARGNNNNKPIEELNISSNASAVSSIAPSASAMSSSYRSIPYYSYYNYAGCMPTSNGSVISAYTNTTMNTTATSNIYHNQITVIDLKRAGYTVEELYKAGYLCEDIRKAGYNVEDLKMAGYSYKELRLAGYKIDELKKIGITPVNLCSFKNNNSSHSSSSYSLFPTTFSPSSSQPVTPLAVM